MFETQFYTSIHAYRLLQKSSPGEIAEKIAAALEKEKTDFERIRCPLCQWQPTAASRWYCSDCDFPEFFHGGCGAFWNTFETRGVCPGCRHQWRWTSCLRCAGWSPHEDWYADKND